MREALAEDPRMKKCAVSVLGFGPCEGQIEWHHVWTYAYKQINELWAILGLCHKHHAMVDSAFLVRDACQRISLHLASADDLAKYPKKAWSQIKLSLGMDI